MRCPQFHHFVSVAKSQSLNLCQMASTLSCKACLTSKFATTTTPKTVKTGSCLDAALVFLYVTPAPFVYPTLPKNSCLVQPQNLTFLSASLVPAFSSLSPFSRWKFLSLVRSFSKMLVHTCRPNSSHDLTRTLFLDLPPQLRNHLCKPLSTLQLQRRLSTAVWE